MKKLLVLGMAMASGYASAATLYDNGTFLTSGNFSVVASTDGTTGVTSSVASGFALAEDFTVTGPGWNVQSLDFYAYQTGSTSFTFTSVTWSILSGTNPNTATVVASGSTSVSNGGLVGYRAPTATPTSTARPVYRINADIPDVTLAAGSYFVTWALSGTGASGPFVPPTIAATGNSYQGPVGGNTFAGVTDGISFRTLEMPFSINGAVAAVPEPATTVLMLAGALALVGGARLRRSVP